MKAALLALLLDGKKDSDAAQLVSTKRVTVSRQAVAAFRKRHAAELVPAVEQVIREAIDYAIGQKVKRVAEYDSLWHRLQTVIDERAAYGLKFWPNVPGMKSGLLVHKLKSLGGGENAQIVDEFELDTAVLQQIQALLERAATELGQLPRPDTRVHIDNRTQVLVREYVGFDPREIG